MYFFESTKKITEKPYKLWHKLYEYPAFIYVVFFWQRSIFCQSALPSPFSSHL